MNLPITIRLNTPVKQFQGPDILTAKVHPMAGGLALWGEITDPATGAVVAETQLSGLYDYEYYARPEAITNWIDAHGQIVNPRSQDDLLAFYAQCDDEANWKA